MKRLVIIMLPKFENENIAHIITDKLEYIQFKKLLNYPNVKHAYILKTHNINFRISENIEMVKDNLRIVSNAINFDYNRIIKPDMRHGSEVKTVNLSNSDEEPELSGRRFLSTDGLLTNKSNITLMTTNADCNLILLYDTDKKIIGNIHAGWRSTFSRIASNAISKMEQNFNSNPENIICCFCPSIRKCHFEVDEDVAKLCYENFSYMKEFSQIMSKGNIKDGKQKYYIDTTLINKILLQEKGIPFTNIVDCNICSVCNANKVHSRRAEGPNFGVGAAFISL